MDSNNQPTNNVDLVLKELERFDIEYNYITNRDKEVKNKLENEHRINFYRNNLPESDDDDYINYTEEKYLYYEEYVNNGMKVDGLNLDNPDEIALELSNIYVNFGQPINPNENIIFKITANDELKGFTYSELALKIMQRYHLIYFLFRNWDMEKGVIKETPTDDMKYRDECFHPTCYVGEWIDNGLACLFYNKQSDFWYFEPIKCL